ncbi:hypothetical protein G6L37_07020 [Agrobacterium rubi]|nr:hypothetical protein [Agrobacterium rubi]NTF25117.1 hypothetical protein [Agrobacterium rubi]
MQEAATQKPRSRVRAALRTTAWIAGLPALFLVEFMLFERFGDSTAWGIAGFVLACVAVVMMGFGLRRLKIASETSGKDYGYGPGIKLILLAAVIVSGPSIGQQANFQKRIYWSGSMIERS